MKNRINSFRYAINGFIVFVRDEFHAKIHLSLALISIILGLAFKICFTEWLSILIIIGIVISMEIINTAIENLANFVSPQKHQLIKKVKDLSAAAVLISSIIALIIGGLIFVPKILELW